MTRVLHLTDRYRWTFTRRGPAGGSASAKKLGATATETFAREAPDAQALSDALTPEAARSETLAEACERVHKERVADGVSDAHNEIGRIRRFASTVIGHLEVTKVTTADINNALDNCKEKGRSKQTAIHLRQDLRSVFTALERKGFTTSNPVDDAERSSRA